jgi:hypothetical protein
MGGVEARWVARPRLVWQELDLVSGDVRARDSAMTVSDIEYHRAGGGRHARLVAPRFWGSPVTRKL